MGEEYGGSITDAVKGAVTKARRAGSSVTKMVPTPASVPVKKLVQQAQKVKKTGGQPKPCVPVSPGTGRGFHGGPVTAAVGGNNSSSTVKKPPTMTVGVGKHKVTIHDPYQQYHKLAAKKSR